MSATKIQTKQMGLVALLLLAAAVPALLSHRAGAADLTQVLVRFDRMADATQTTGTVCAKPTTVATETGVDVEFPAGFGLGAAGDFTVDTTNTAWPATAIAWPSITTASAVNSQAVTFGSGDLTPGTLYCFNWDDPTAVQTSGVGTNLTGTVTTTAAGPVNVDSSIYSTSVIADDQIVVTATVPQTFSFALNANADALGILNQGIVNPSPTPRTATVNTNAKNGWLVWARDLNTGLASAAAGATVASTAGNNTISAGTEGYNMGVVSSQSSGTGTISVAGTFVGGTLGRGGGLNTNLQTVATSNGTANGAVLTLTNNATISSITPAATDYTDTITLVGAGLF